MTDMNAELRVATWNVWGMCNKDMQKEDKKFITTEKLNICTVVETHIKENQLPRIIGSDPWVLIDWNVSLNAEDHSEGGSCKTNDMMEFQECIDQVEIEDINRTGIHFTWVQSRLNPSNGILKKIDKSYGQYKFRWGLS